MKGIKLYLSLELGRHIYLSVHHIHASMSTYITKVQEEYA